MDGWYTERAAQDIYHIHESFEISHLDIYIFSKLLCIISLVLALEHLSGFIFYTENSLHNVHLAGIGTFCFGPLHNFPWDLCIGTCLKNCLDINSYN